MSYVVKTVNMNLPSKPRFRNVRKNRFIVHPANPVNWLISIEPSISCVIKIKHVIIAQGCLTHNMDAAEMFADSSK